VTPDESTTLLCPRDDTSGVGDTCLTCASSLGVLWLRTAAKIHTGQHEVPTGESGYGSQLGFLKMNKKKRKKEEPEG